MILFRYFVRVAAKEIRVKHFIIFPIFKKVIKGKWQFEFLREVI